MISANKELQELNQSLEDRVSSRTIELEQANQRNEKRVRQFEAIAQVAQATASNESLETLLPRLVSLVSEQFGFYHTGIFLMDEKREYAVLSAANSDGGRQMLSRGHKLQIGQSGIVGFVSATGTPRIALDVGSDAVFFDNPDLPNTRSEMALPLSILDEVIGVLDVQSTEPNAFQDEDVDILSTLADQVAIAIQNSRTYETMQELLKDAQKESAAYFQDAWRVMQSDASNIGFRVIGNEAISLTTPLNSEQVEKAVMTKQTVAQSGERATLAIPIRLRNEVIGVMDIRTPTEHEWDDDEVDIAEAVAERLSLALESSLLLKSTQRQADLERVTAEISSKIGASTQFDTILRTAAEELSRVLGGSDVLVQLNRDEHEAKE
jgi:GAF domain-containing protein